jgi:hypothetical protein
MRQVPSMVYLALPCCDHFYVSSTKMQQQSHDQRVVSIRTLSMLLALAQRIAPGEIDLTAPYKGVTAFHRLLAHLPNSCHMLQLVQRHPFTSDQLNQLYLDEDDDEYDDTEKKGRRVSLLWMAATYHSGHIFCTMVERGRGMARAQQAETFDINLASQPLGYTPLHACLYCNYYSAEDSWQVWALLHRRLHWGIDPFAPDAAGITVFDASRIKPQWHAYAADRWTRYTRDSLLPCIEQETILPVRDLALLVLDYLGTWRSTAP